MSQFFNDLDDAYKQMLREPVVFADAMNEVIGKRERGAHRARQQAIALGTGIIRAVCNDLSLFKELRNAEYLKGNARVQAATKQNFHEVVPFTVATRIFHNTEATPNRILVYGYVMGYFAPKKIPVPLIPEKIKAMKGIDGVYGLMKNKNANSRSAPAGSKTATAHNTATGRSKGGMGALSAPKSSGTAGQRLSVETILENYLLIAMPTEAVLDRFRSDPVRPREYRGLKIVHGGDEPNGLRAWKFVSELDLGARRPAEDNDNAADEDDDAA